MISVMKSYLVENLKATDDELNYLEEITKLRSKRRNPLPIGNSGYSSPSVIIDDFLYHGDLVHASNVKLLNSLGIKNIVNVCDCALDQTINNNFNVVWLNIYDELTEDIRRYIDPVNAFLTDCKQKKEKVLVHCQMGISRSSAMILAFLMKSNNQSLLEAYDYLHERRRMAAPNLSFFIQLIRYEKELKEKDDDAQNRADSIMENP